jgi:hypothetical protein
MLTECRSTYEHIACAAHEVLIVDSTLRCTPYFGTFVTACQHCSGLLATLSNLFEHVQLDCQHVHLFRVRSYSAQRRAAHAWTQRRVARVRTPSLSCLHGVSHDSAVGRSLARLQEFFMKYGEPADFKKSKGTGKSKGGGRGGPY